MSFAGPASCPQADLRLEALTDAQAARLGLATRRWRRLSHHRWRLLGEMPFACNAVFAAGPPTRLPDDRPVLLSVDHDGRDVPGGRALGNRASWRLAGRRLLVCCMARVLFGLELEDLPGRAA